MEVERKQSFFENILQCQGFPWQSFILLVSVTPGDACPGTKCELVILGMLPMEVGGKYMQCVPITLWQRC